MTLAKNLNQWVSWLFFFTASMLAQTAGTNTQVLGPSPQYISPDVYELTGEGITITYLPTGAGGLARFTYQDSQRTLTFTGNQIRKADVPDQGTVVSVTIVKTVDSGSTTFSVVIPRVNLANQKGASTGISSFGVTTVHKFSVVPGLNPGQREVYTVATMTGTASVSIVPL